MAVCLILTLLPATALAVDEPIKVMDFDDLQTAQTAKEGSIVEVTGEIKMTEPVAFQNPITLKLTGTANITYTSDNVGRVELIKLAGGSTLDMAAGAQVTMNGDEGTQNANRDWRAIYSTGDLTVDQFAGDITVNHAKGRGLYANNDLIFTAPMEGTVTMNNPNGDNRYLYGIVSYEGNVIFQKGIADTAAVTVEYGGGNNGYGIAAQQGSVIIEDDMAGDVNVQMGVSHAGYGIYGYKSVTVTGDISGSVYARGGSGRGYGIYAETGDISIVEISGTVTGDCYNQIMNNSQMTASALYAAGSIYGADAGTPLQLTGILSSTVGRNNAFTVQAAEDVSIKISGAGKIKAQSSYGADWDLTGGSDPMSNNWGGAAAGVVAGGDIDVTGSDDAIQVVSESKEETPVEAGFLAETGNQKSVTNISNFLYTAAAEDPATAIEASKDLTEAEKDLINGYDEIMADLYSAVALQVGTDYRYATIAEAVAAAEPGDIIQIMEDQTIDSMVTINKSVTITAAKGVTITGSGADGKPAIYLDADNVKLSGLTINFATADENGNIAAIGMGHDNSGIVVDGCTITTGSNNRALAPYDGASLAYATSMAYTITGNTITTDSNQGAIFAANFSGEISGNTFNRVAGTAGNVWAINGTLMNNLRIEKNIFNDCGVIANGTVTIYDNDFALTAQANGIVFGAYGQYGTPNLTVEENTFTGSGTAFYFTDLYGTNTGKAGTLATEFADNDFAAGVTAVNNTVPDQVYFDKATGSVSLVTSAGAGDDLQNIINDAKEGDVIVLSDDVVLNAPLTINTPVTINGNNHTISVSESFSGGDVITVYADDTTIQNVIIDGNNQKSNYGIQFYEAENGRVENVTAQNNGKRGIHVNASTVTAAGTITLSSNKWGNSINVGFGSGINSAPGASLDVTNATLVGVDSIYADAGDVERAGIAGEVITVTDGNNTYVAVGDGVTPVLFVPKDTVEDTAVITVVAPDGTPTYYEKTASLKEAIENAPEGSTVTLAKDTSFTITSAVEVTKDVTINGNGSTITADNCVGFYIKDDLNAFTVKDLTLKGQMPAGTQGNEGTDAFMGIGTYNGCYGVADLQLDNVTIDGFSYGLYFGMNPDGSQTTFNDKPVKVTANDLVVQNCYIKGAYFEKLTDSTFTDCTFTDNGNNPDKVQSNNNKTWMCGVDINLKGGNYKDIKFIDCTFTGNGANSGTALHIKARDDGNNYGKNPATLDGVTVTGCTFTGNNAAVEAPIVLGEPGANNETPVNVYIQPDVDYINNLAKGSVVTITFDTNGGDPVADMVVAKGTTITLPDCNNAYYYKFAGWQYGSQTYYAGDEVKANSNMTFEAQWEKRFQSSGSGSSSSSSGDYAITVDAGKHGDVSVSPKRADEGDTVTITVDPDKGYEVDEVIVTDKNGDSIRVRDRGDGEYTFTMPDSKVTVEVTFVEEGDELSFVDVAKSDYYYDAVKWAVDNGVTTGVTDTIFAPGNPCTRAQTVTFLWRAAGMPQAANRVNPFTDVSVNDYYYEAVLWAVENGITGGTTATTFSPNATCTRAQVVTFLWRYSKEDASILPMFTDVAESDYYYGAVAWAVENGVTTGVTDTTFAPGNPCTRGQIVTFLYRYMGK